MEERNSAKNSSSGWDSSPTWTRTRATATDRDCRTRCTSSWSRPCLLARTHPRLPITFFDLFTGALNRWVRVYDYRDALERVEQLREWYEADPDGEHVELPAVDAATPTWLR